MTWCATGSCISALWRETPARSRGSPSAIQSCPAGTASCWTGQGAPSGSWGMTASSCSGRSEEHTSELQSRLHLVCRLLLEKKKKKKIDHTAFGTCNDIEMQGSVD